MHLIESEQPAGTRDREGDLAPRVPEASATSSRRTSARTTRRPGGARRTRWPTSSTAGSAAQAPEPAPTPTPRFSGSAPGPGPLRRRGVPVTVQTADGALEGVQIGVDRPDLPDQEPGRGQPVHHALPWCASRRPTLSSRSRSMAVVKRIDGRVVDEVLDDHDPGAGTRRRQTFAQRPAGALVVPLQNVLDDVDIRLDRNFLPAVPGDDPGPVREWTPVAQPGIGFPTPPRADPSAFRASPGASPAGSPAHAPGRRRCPRPLRRRSGRAARRHPVPTAAGCGHRPVEDVSRLGRVLVEIGRRTPCRTPPRRH